MPLPFLNRAGRRKKATRQDAEGFISNAFRDRIAFVAARELLTDVLDRDDETGLLGEGLRIRVNRFLRNHPAPERRSPVPLPSASEAEAEVRTYSPPLAGPVQREVELGRDARFEGGPLDGQTLFVRREVNVVDYAGQVEYVPANEDRSVWRERAG